MQGLRVCVMVCVVLAHSLMFHFRLPQADIKFMENVRQLAFLFDLILVADKFLDNK